MQFIGSKTNAQERKHLAGGVNLLLASTFEVAYKRRRPVTGKAVWQRCIFAGKNQSFRFQSKAEVGFTVVKTPTHQPFVRKVCDHKNQSLHGRLLVARD